MPKEVVYGGHPEFFYRGEDELQVDEIRVGEGPIFRRGVIVRWDHLGGHGLVQLATATVCTSDPDSEKDANYVSVDDPRQLADLIRKLKKAGRQAFGESEW